MTKNFKQILRERPKGVRPIKFISIKYSVSGSRTQYLGLPYNDQVRSLTLQPLSVGNSAELVPWIRIITLTLLSWEIVKEITIKMTETY